MNILGIDYGIKKIGLALGDLNTGIIMPLKTIETREGIKKVSEIISQYNISRVVAGLPSSSKTTSERVRRFIRDLALPAEMQVFYINENLSSAHAKSMLSSLKKEYDVNIKKRGAKDTMSAILILEEWFTKNRN